MRVFCLIDGIGFYGRDVFRADIEHALSILFSYQDTQGAEGSTVKVLAASAWSTRVVRKFFADNIVSMETISRPGVGGGTKQLERQLRDIF